MRITFFPPRRLASAEERPKSSPKGCARDRAPPEADRDARDPRCVRASLPGQCAFGDFWQDKSHPGAEHPAITHCAAHAALDRKVAL